MKPTADSGMKKPFLRPLSITQTTGEKQVEATRTSPQLEVVIEPTKATSLSRSPSSPGVVKYRVSFVTVTDVVHLLASSAKSVIIDVRDNRLFQISHLRNAVNVSCSSKLMSKRAQIKWLQECPSLDKSTPLIVYDSHGIIGHQSCLADTFIKFLTEKHDDVRLLQGGYDELSNSTDVTFVESCLKPSEKSQLSASPTHPATASIDILGARISQILPFLFIGNHRDASDQAILDEYGITDILNVTNTLPFYFEGKYRYHRIPASDNSEQDLSVYFEQARSIIDDVKQRNGCLLVHCWAGVSRSVTLVVYYLMRELKIDLKTAMKKVQSCRSVAAPNLHFMGQLFRREQF